MEIGLGEMRLLCVAVEHEGVQAVAQRGGRSVALKKLGVDPVQR